MSSCLFDFASYLTRSLSLSFFANSSWQPTLNSYEIFKTGIGQGLPDERFIGQWAGYIDHCATDRSFNSFWVCATGKRVKLVRSDQVEQKELDAGEAKHPPEDALINRIGDNTNATGSGSQEAGTDVLKSAQATMDKRMDDDKLNLSVQQLAEVKTIEQAIIKGDSTALTNALKKYENDPKAAEAVLETVSKDLAAVGINARWSYGTKTKDTESENAYFMAGKEDFGHLTFYAENGDTTYTSVQFSTSGKTEGINRPIPRADGMVSPLNASPVDADEGLDFIIEDALK
jgi:hypothetical protein